MSEQGRTAKPPEEMAAPFSWNEKRPVRPFHDVGYITIPMTSRTGLTERPSRFDRQTSFRLVLLLQLFEPIVLNERVTVVLRATVRDTRVQAVGL